MQKGEGKIHVKRERTLHAVNWYRIASTFSCNIRSTAIGWMRKACSPQSCDGMAPHRRFLLHRHALSSLLKNRCSRSKLTTFKLGSNVRFVVRLFHWCYLLKKVSHNHYVPLKATDVFYNPTIHISLILLGYEHVQEQRNWNSLHPARFMFPVQADNSINRRICLCETLKGLPPPQESLQCAG